MDIAGRLATIQQEIQQVENQKLHCEQRLRLFWEHPPALDPHFIGQMMQGIRDQIRDCENRRRALRLEQEELIVRAAAANPPPNPPRNEH